MLGPPLVSLVSHAQQYAYYESHGRKTAVEAQQFGQKRLVKSSSLMVMLRLQYQISICAMAAVCAVFKQPTESSSPI